ncbi:MAG TPA: plastocyanin/azurin family copper-binding protein [Mycobacteriales bacterium]|nr:plastocyanin/azurin family copper-binding protein [Mycobacteriales bacterium]
MTPRPTPRRTALVAVLIGAGATVPLLGSTTSAHAANASVSATSGNTFEPSRVAINVGDSVTWTTTGGVNHTVTSSSPNWEKDDAIPVPGRSTSFTFKAAGTYAYYCKTHGSPSAGMRGTVTVAAPVRPPASRTPSARPSPSPTRPPTVAPTRSPTRSPTPRPTPSRSAPPSRSPSPTPVRTTTAPPIGVPSVQPAPTPATAAPLPTVADEPSDQPTVDLGSGGLGPRPASDRGRGLPTFIALVALVGVVSAQVRALLALPVED